MVLTPQLLQWQMWVNDEAKEILQEQQSHRNPAQLTFDILTGTGTMAEVGAQLQNTAPPMVYWIKRLSCVPGQRLTVLCLMGLLLKYFKDGGKEIH